MTQLTGKWFNQVSNGLRDGQSIQCKDNWTREDWNGLVKEGTVQVVDERLTCNGLMTGQVIQCNLSNGQDETEMV